MDDYGMARRQLEGIALVRADLHCDTEAAIALANNADPVAVAALAHTFSQVIQQTFNDPAALLDTLTRVYTLALIEETS